MQIKFFSRYRNLSLNNILGVNKLKRRTKKIMGLSKVQRVLNTPPNIKRNVLRKFGYYSEPLKFLRFVKRII